LARSTKPFCHLAYNAAAHEATLRAVKDFLTTKLAALKDGCPFLLERAEDGGTRDRVRLRLCNFGNSAEDRQEAE